MNDTHVPYNPGAADDGGERKPYPVLEAGIYQAVMTAIEKTDATTLICTYDVYDPAGNQNLILKDWLNLSKPVCLHRFKNMARATGNLPTFEDGDFNGSMCLNLNFTIRISKKPSKDGVGFRNWIDGVVVDEENLHHSGTPVAHTPLSDGDIPF